MDGKTPGISNFRNIANKIMDKARDEHPWFGFEQEYILMTHDGTSATWPIGFPKGGYAKAQGQYYCSVGSLNSIGRSIPECHMLACLAAGIQISGVNAEVFPGQWEYQLAPIEGIQACDELWMSRYILRRVCEDFDLEVTFEPKPISGDWNGSGCHMNFSTDSTRSENGYEKIIENMEALSLKQQEHMTVYGENNELRLSGRCETSAMDKFSYGIANRGVSVRLPTTTVAARSGYFEDRRPAGNVDPYLSGAMMVDSVCLEGQNGQEILSAYERCKRNKKL